MGILDGLKGRFAPLPAETEGEDDPFFDLEDDEYIEGSDNDDSGAPEGTPELPATDVPADEAPAEESPEEAEPEAEEPEAPVI